ncbi:tetratricopeptide repeat-containing sulfotransferase family protein [Ovoidimarina sediminis]|uniref:tetratricopeptide repeat-containing sulfotransferase family protein n=1 Tax=Ovoidimarina sediminis TaxID=3079856 RepID=UPI002908E647|nr:sulfotransferase [Rhodophyticola sp. MJ-SS7]MDU8943786.1 sulfotransferase [Rhodophyticola sp. MJ-SS7]
MRPDTKEDLKQGFAEARKLQKAGKDEEALSAYGKLIATNPKIPEVHFQVARLFIKNDRPDRAIKHATVATVLRPRIPDVWRLRADVVRTLSDPEEAKKFQDDIGRVKDLDKRLVAELKTGVDLPKKSRPDLGSMPPAKMLSLAELLNSKKWQEAEKLARSLLSIYPDVGALHDVLGVAMSATRRNQEAEQSFQTAIQLDRGLSEPHVHYGRHLLTIDKPELALRHANAALRLSPGQPDALLLRGMIMKKLGRDDYATNDFERALSLHPKNLDAAYALASIYHERKDYVAAEEVIEDILESREAETRFLALGVPLKVELGKPQAALELLKRTRVENDEEKGFIQARIAEIEQTLGNFDAANEAFQRSIQLAPRRGETYRVYLTSKKIELDDPIVSEMMSLWQDDTMNDFSRANLGFALGKVMEDNKSYNRVFEFLHPANAMIASTDPYDMDRRKELQDKIHASLDSVDWSNVTLESESSFAPIFVTGMPRSGTTLVEQIISSHSRVSGGGELAFGVRQALEAIKRNEGPFRPLSDIHKSELEELANKYQAYVGKIAEPNDHTTDKSIQVYEYVGILKMAMPRARFVIVRRDPRDNLLSIYKNIFPAGGHMYSYNLKACAHYYKLFENAVNFWRERTPDWFYEIQYEDLVANPEEETRKLIDAVGLEWEDQCLEFHKNDRRVRTLSVYQVRQPMYKSSTKAWERYRDDLTELFDALGPEYMDAAE